MKLVYPDYYKSFRCIAQNCRHSCCVGWEIDIDPETLNLYQNIPGDFGKRLKNNISLEDTPHFILAENERCPFLNEANLCDIYSELGENSLCQICSDHPRFYNELSSHTEAGLGLCCEEAARIILTKEEPFALLNLPKDALNDPMLLLRDEILQILQNRENPLVARVENVVNHIKKHCVKSDISSVLNHPISHYIPLFKSLEKLNADWGVCLSDLQTEISYDTQCDFDLLVSESNREAQLEQFVCYLIYRHMAKAEFEEDAILYAGFALLSLRLIASISLGVFAKKGEISTEDFIELARLFSCEIEYSDQNTDKILDFLEEDFFSS